MDDVDITEHEISSSLQEDSFVSLNFIFEKHQCNQSLHLHSNNNSVEQKPSFFLRKVNEHKIVVTE